MSDLFGRAAQNIRTPITADLAQINWGTQIATAVNISISYMQPITRRRTIGNQAAIIYSGQPAGTISIQRLLADGASDLFAKPGWSACSPTDISLNLSGCNGASGYSVKATGCVVSNFQVSAEAEGLTVIDNVTIEFLQLAVGGS